MKYYTDILNEEYTKKGINKNDNFKFIYKWVGYKNGEAEWFDSEKEAKAKYKLVERVQQNKKEFEEYKQIVDKIHTTAYDIWIKELREEWYELSDEMFQTCYSYSYTENHSSGYDEVGNGMYDIVEFAKRVYNLGVKEASKK